MREIQPGDDPRVVLDQIGQRHDWVQCGSAKCGAWHCQTPGCDALPSFTDCDRRWQDGKNGCIQGPLDY